MNHIPLALPLFAIVLFVTISGCPASFVNKPICGDTVCEADEKNTCPGDCGAKPAGVGGAPGEQALDPSLAGLPKPGTSIPNTNDCRDFDNGFFPEKRGAIFLEGSAKSENEDYCRTNSILVEFYCDTKRKQDYDEAEVRCARGCKDGACNPETATLCPEGNELPLARAGSGTEISPKSLTAQSEPSDIEVNTSKLSSSLLGVSGKSLGATEMMASASERQKNMLKLAESDPAAFLRNAIPTARLQGLPKDVQELIEKDTSLEGDLEVFETPHVEEPLEPGEDAFVYYLNTGEKRYKLRFAQDIPTEAVSGYRVKIGGYALANYVVSKSQQSMRSLVEPLAANTGAMRVAIIRTKPVNTTNPNTPLVLTTMTTTKNFTKEASYNQADIAWDVYGWYELEENSQDSLNSLAVADKDIDFRKYSFAIIVDPRLSCCSANLGRMTLRTDDGRTNIGVLWAHPRVFQNRDLVAVLVHELGHAMSLRHAAFYNCGTKPIDINTKCKSIEYGDPYDVMGDRARFMHYNGPHKETLLWMENTTKVALKSGTYKLNAYESGTGTLSLKVPRTKNANGAITDYYYLQYMTGTGFDADVSRLQPRNGPQVRFKGIVQGAGGGSETHLITMSPGNLPNDVAIGKGQTFTDLSGLKITTLDSKPTETTICIQ